VELIIYFYVVLNFFYIYLVCNLILTFSSMELCSVELIIYFYVLLDFFIFI
jgi:hypothetical protein